MPRKPPAPPGFPDDDGDWSLPAQELAALEELAALRERLSQLRGQGVVAYYDDPVGFVRDCVNFKPRTDGQPPGLAPYQAEIIGSLPQLKRIAVRGPRGLGKSQLASMVILWFAITRDAAGKDWKIITTAGSWQQLRDYLWREVAKWAHSLNWEKIGRPPFNQRGELMKTGLSLYHGLALASSPDTPAKIEGVHADCVLAVLDEAKIIGPDTFNSIEGAFSGSGEGSGLEAFVLAISTPGEPSGRFYDIHRRAKGLEDWHPRHVTLAEALAAGRMVQSWADQRKELWGEHSALYQNHVLGEFCADDEDAVIPLRWVEEAFTRWREWDKDGRPDPEGIATVGVDVARSGHDKSAAAIRHGDVITAIRTWAKADTMETTGRVKGILSADPALTAIVDVIGIGAGVYDRLREQGEKAEPFTAGRKTLRKDATGQFGFRDVRSAAWWNLREMLDPSRGATLALPPDDELAGDLTVLHYKHGSDGRLQVETKDEVRKRIGRSTDRGDAVIQACWMSGGSWHDAYSTMECPSCTRGFMRDGVDGKPRTECPHCNAALDEENDLVPV